MVTQMITLKMDKKFLKEVDSIVEDEGYKNRTELIRKSLHEAVDRVKLKKAMIKVGKLRGISKTKVSKEQYEKVRKDILNLLD